MSGGDDRNARWDQAGGKKEKVYVGEDRNALWYLYAFGSPELANNDAILREVRARCYCPIGIDGGGGGDVGVEEKVVESIIGEAKAFRADRGAESKKPNLLAQTWLNLRKMF